MQKLWQRLRNLVKGYVPGLRKQGYKFKYEDLDTVQVVDGKLLFGKTTATEEDWHRYDEQALFSFFKKEWQEQEDKGLLPRYVAGVDPIQEPGELDVLIFSFGGELGAYPAEGDVSEPCYDSEKYYRLNLGGAYDVRQPIDDPRLPWFGERITECMGDSRTALALALRTGRGEEQTQESPGKISVRRQ